jgi:hypothetical protein
MSSIQIAWTIYFIGCVGCTVAAWWLFLRAWRFVRYSAVVTVMTLLFTPYAIDPHTMTMAPAIYSLVFEGMSSGIESIKPLLKLMIGIWLIAIILVAVFVVLTRKSANFDPPEEERFKPERHHEHKPARKADYKKRGVRAPGRRAKPEVQSAREQPRIETGRNEIPRGEMPMRAIRD